MLYEAHYVNQSNLLNPAVQSSCKWYVGLPAISSFHYNYANSFFKANQINDVNSIVAQSHRRNHIDSELHVTLFAIGRKYKEWYFNFTLTEKNNAPATISKDMLELGLNGNSQFEGETAEWKGSGVYFNHYREYAFGASYRYRSDLTIGAKGKLLFGKLNATTRATNIGLHTDANSFDLEFTGDANINASMPITINQDPSGYITGITVNDDINFTELALNRKNPGFALDFGAIKRMDKDWTISASVLDIGLIRYRSNLNHVTINTQVSFDGVNDNLENVTLEDYLNDSIQYQVTTDKPYTFWMAPQIIVGSSYQLMPDLKASTVFYNKIYATKLITRLNFSLDYNPYGYIHLLAGYTFQNYEFNNFGAGVALGNHPIQFYVFSDNVHGLIWPLRTRNINLRFGLNVNLGCRLKVVKPDKSGIGALPCPNIFQRKNKNQVEEESKRKRILEKK